MPRLHTLLLALIFALLGGLLVYCYQDCRYQVALEIMADQARELGAEKRVSEGLSREYSELMSKPFLEGP
ncbi:MAG: hypothetical protein KKD18_02825 [Nanoarchaeota archaeon]|nr:hypothetical protein [Nanoarchaeota archaeon]